MKISEFTYQNPDSDGDIRLSATGVVENDSDHDIEYITCSNIVVNGNGVTVGGGDTYHDDTFISSKDSAEVELISWGSVHKNLVDGDPSGMKSYFALTGYRREFIKVGEIDFPQKEGDVVELKKVISIGGVIDLMGISVYRHKNDDDGDVEVTLRAGMKNTSEQFFNRVQLTVKVLDQREAELSDDVTVEPLLPKESKVIEPWLGRMKAGKIKNATIKITASVFLPVLNFTQEGEPTLES